MSQFELYLLGTPKTMWCGDPYSLLRRQARALLYYLAAVAEPVQRERLAFLFWPDLPHSQSRHNLKRLLSVLRRSLPDPELITSDHSAIGLAHEQIWCDVTLFQTWLVHSVPSQLAQAVDLYRGTFLDGFSLPASPEYEEWQFQMQTQLERKYLAALSSLLDASHKHGDWESAVSYAVRYLTVDNLAEDVHRRLIRSFWAMGDRHAAAKQFEQCVLILERELGVRPLPETRAVYEAAIADRPESAQTTRLNALHWAILPSLHLPLVGRDAIWQDMSAAYHRVRSGGLIHLTGEPGVGKSRLIQEFATASAAFVLVGGHPVGMRSVPFTGIAEALRPALRAKQRWRNIRPIWLAEASRLLPEIDEVFPGLPQLVTVDPAQAQARLFEALNQCLLGLAADGPLLLCLDDLHWADSATLEWLADLPGRITGSRLCLLSTGRTGWDQSLADVQRAFARRDLLVKLHVPRLSEDGVVGILEQLPQRVADLQPLAVRLHHATGGNPFFLLETVRALLEDDGITEPPEQLPLAPTVEAAIRRRLERLSPLGRQILEAAAVLSPELIPDLVSHTAGRSDLETVQGLDELTGRQILAEEPLRFGHDLVRQTTYSEIKPWRQRILHRRAADALRAQPMRQGVATWAAIAGHYDRAGDLADAVTGYGEAARASQHLHAHQEAIGYLERAMALGREGAIEPETAAHLQELMGDSLIARGRHNAAERAYATALAGLPTTQRLARAILERKVSDTLHLRLLTSEAKAAVIKASETLGEPVGHWSVEWLQAWLDIQLSLKSILYYQGDFGRLARLLAAIEPVVKDTGTSAQQVDFVFGLAELAVRQEHFTLSQDTVDTSRASLAVAEQAGDLGQIAWAQFGVGFALLWSGDVNGAERALQSALRLSEEAGLGYRQLIVLVYLACCYRFQGDVESTRAVVGRGLAHAARMDMPIYAGAIHAHQAWLHWREDDLRLGLIEGNRAMEAWGDFPYPFRWLGHWVLLAVHTARDDLAQAIEQAIAILHPSQRRQPGNLPETLTGGVHAWENGELSEAEAALRRAIALAQGEGYL